MEGMGDPSCDVLVAMRGSDLRRWGRVTLPQARRTSLGGAGADGRGALAQIIVFLCYGARLNKWVLQTYHPEYMKSPLVYHPGHRARAWRFLTYMFMHVG